MLIELLVGQLFLALFNVGNAFFDAYRILNNKHIAHAINFIAYLLAAIVICFLLGIKFHIYLLFGSIPIVYGPGMLFLLSAFFNRQFSFDIPLNLRRGLAWDYQSTANPPKSITDRIERAIFGTGENIGRKIFKVYLACYCLILTVWVWVV